MKLKSILCALAVVPCVTAAADNTPMWLRHPAISPDGKTIAFDFRGDIFTIPVTGGNARQITTNAAYDAMPVWSPDGSKLAFMSTRNGSADIFVIPANGGTAKRMTTFSGSETPVTWLNDSTIVFSARIAPAAVTGQAQFLPQTYTVTLDGKRPRLFRSMPMPALDTDDRGRIVYHDKKGFEDPLRKHERSSGTSDIWLIDGDKYTKLTTFDGHDLNPLWTDDNTITYLSEQDGTLNVWSMDANGGNQRQLTKFTDHPVRSLSHATNGTLAFGRNGEIFTLTPGGQPVKVDVTVTTDDYDSDFNKVIRTNGASSMAVSPDGEQVAFVLRGDVYVTSTKYKTTKRITNTSAQERTVNFSPDGRSLVYDSDRDGQWKIFIAKIDNKNEKTFPYSTGITEKLLYSSEKAAQQPAFSPDGKKVAFLEDRTTLRVIDPETGAVNTALDGKFNYSYSDGDVSFVWSPDSRWFLTSYIGVGGWNNMDIALVSADGKEVTNLTQSGYTNANPRWALGGKAITFETTKYGMRNHGSWGEQGDVVVMFLDSEAWDKFNSTAEEAEIAKAQAEEKEKDKNDDKDSKKDKKGKADKKTDEVKPLQFDLANRRYRIRRITGMSSAMGDYVLNNDGTKLYYVAVSPDGTPNLMVADIKEGSTSVLVSNLSGGFELDKKGENLFVLGGKGIQKITLADGKAKPVEFEAVYDRHPATEREYIYDHVVSQVRDKFYDINLHGVDWKMYGENYRRFLPSINNNYDFAELLSELLGELNASHTGARYRGSSQTLNTASLGAFFDDTFDGDGLLVTEVLPRGPLATKAANVHPGDVILSIDGEMIRPNTDINDLLAGKAGRNVNLDIQRVGKNNVDLVKVKPISQGEFSDQLYHRWIERNAAIVDSLSNGRIGYVHIQGMDSPSFREVYSDLLGKYRNCDAVVVDTRFNGGGWLHNDIAVLLSGKEYVRYSPRGQYVGSDPFNQWTKPSVMLVSEANYSDAHGTPYVYKTLGIGKVVGAPVPGTMTAVWWETQIDPTLVFGIPQVTSLDRQGQALENKQLNPDVLIYNNPGDMLKGHDAQLEGAVRSLLDTLNSK